MICTDAHVTFYVKFSWLCQTSNVIEKAGELLLKFRIIVFNENFFQPFSVSDMCTDGKTDRKILIGAPRGCERA